MKKNILYLAQYFPPGDTIAARRFTHLARGNENSFAICRFQAGGTWPAVEGVRYIPVKARDLRSGVGPKGLAAGKHNRLLRPLLPLRQSFPFLYLTDDGGPHYRRQAYQKACELIEKHGIATVFSSFRPWSDHLVARRLKRKYPQLRWIADFRDLPVDPVRNDSWWPALQRWWGQRVIASADEVWCVSEGQRAQLLGWHPDIRVVRNALLRLPPEGPPPVTERFTIVYTGSLYPRLQTVAPLLTALRQLLAAGTIDPAKLRLVYRGKDASLFREWTRALPADLLDIQPSIAPAAAQKMQQNAQLLLLLNWSAPGYYGVLTAKLWDYLASGRPILALVNGPGDQELTAIIEGADAGAVYAVKEQGAVTEWVKTAYLRWVASGVLPWQVDRQQLATFLAAVP